MRLSITDYKNKREQEKTGEYPDEVISERKVQGGKLIQVKIRYNTSYNTSTHNTGVLITGDFFLHPEDKIRDIEKALHRILILPKQQDNRKHDKKDKEDEKEDYEEKHEEDKKEKTVKRVYKEEKEDTEKNRALVISAIKKSIGDAELIGASIMDIADLFIESKDKAIIKMRNQQEDD